MQNQTSANWLNDVKFDANGLIPAIAQDHKDGQILMVAWMNKEALALTVEKQQAVYWSRSRQKLWHKGETSGHFQQLHALYMDCDADVICLTVTQLGNIACHTGRHSCFYKQLIDGEWQTIAPVLKNPEDIYENPKKEIPMTSATHNNHEKSAQAMDTLSALSAILESRKQADADSSYVASLYHKGLNKILEKIGEEATETIIAAKDLHIAQNTSNIAWHEKKPPKENMIYEVADLWFHTMVMLSYFNIHPQAILDELASRFGVSGHAEKAARKS